MSDDLISRKSLLENLNSFAPEHYSTLVNDLIAKEPIAFDKEKVLEKLKTNMNSFAGISGQAVTFMFSNGYYNGTKDAIEIVEKGGIE